MIFESFRLPMEEAVVAVAVDEIRGPTPKVGRLSNAACTHRTIRCHFYLSVHCIHVFIHIYIYLFICTIIIIIIGSDSVSFCVVVLVGKKNNWLNGAHTNVIYIRVAQRPWERYRRRRRLR